MLLAFYLGVALEFAIFLLPPLATQLQVPDVPATGELHQANTPMLAASIMVTVLGGSRSTCRLRLTTGIPGKLDFSRHSVAIGSAGLQCYSPGAIPDFCRTDLARSRGYVFLDLADAPSQGHLSLLGIMATELSPWTFHKIPFGCSYLPGKSQVHMVFFAVIALAFLLAESVRFEQRALQQFSILGFVILILATGVLEPDGSRHYARSCG